MKKLLLLLLFIILFVQKNLFVSSSTTIAQNSIINQTYYIESLYDPNKSGCEVTLIIKLNLDSEIGAPASIVPINTNVVLVSSLLSVYDQFAFYKLVGILKTKGLSTTALDGINEQGQSGIGITGTISFVCVDNPTDLDIVVTNKSLPVIRRNSIDQPYLFEIAVSIPELEYNMALSFVLNDTHSPFSITQQQVSKRVYILKFSLASHPDNIKNSNQLDPQIEIVPQVYLNGDVLNYTSLYINPLVAEANGNEQFSNITFYPFNEPSFENFAYVTFNVKNDGINEFGTILPALTNNLDQLETSLRIPTGFAYAIKGNKTHTVFIGAIKVIKETQFDWFLESSNTLDSSTFRPQIHNNGWTYDTSLVAVEISGVCTFAPFSWTAIDILPVEYSFSTMNSKNYQNYIPYWCVSNFVSTSTDLKFGHSILLSNGYVNTLGLQSTAGSFYGNPYSTQTLNYGTINTGGQVYPAPSLNDMSLVKITSTTSSFYYGGYTIKFLISSDITFYYMDINGEVTVNMTNIVSGSTNDGQYEIHVDNNFIRKISMSPFTITICNILFTCTKTIYSPAELEVLGVNGPFPSLQLPTNFPERTIYNITNLYFKHKELNTTGIKPLENIIYFGTIDGATAKDDDGIYLILNYLDSKLMNGKYQFTFNNTIGLYTCKFPVAANLYDGVFDYSIQYYSMVYSYSSLFSVIGDNSTFLVNSVQADMYPPLVESITTFPSTNRLTLNKSQSNIFGWDVTLDEGVNGFSYGEFNITSDYDKLGYQFKFNSSNLINGNMLSIRIDLNGFGPITDCYTQQYSITSVYLLDKQGYQTSNSISALFKTSFIQDLSIIVDCSNSNESPTSDINPPYLSGFSLDPDYSYVVYSEGKDTIKLSFSITDDESGLSKRHHPTVYFEDISGNLLAMSINNGLHLNETDGFTSTYLCNAVFPFGWTDVSISIYGIVDNYSNIKGYDPLELKEIVNDRAIGMIDFNPFISVQFGSTPFISKIYPTFDSTYSTAQFIIQGIYFGSNFSKIGVTVKYISDDGVVVDPSSSSTKDTPAPAAVTMRELFSIIESDANFEIVSLYGNEIVLNVDFTNPVSQNLQIQLLIDGTPTNTFNYQLPSEIVVATPTPTPTATSSTSGSISTTSSTSTPTTTSPSNEDLSVPLEGVSITIDPNSPSGSLNQVEMKLTSIINIHQIREVQTLNNNTVLHQFDLRSKWTPITSTIPNQYMYSNQLSNSQASIVYVTLNIFDKSSTFEFAGETHPIVQNSIKYTVNITNYKTESPLNNLQLIMQAQLNSSQTDDICSKKTVDKLGDSDVLTVQLNDKSLYCRFLKTAIIDGTLVVNNITHVNLNTEFSALVKPNSGQYYYGIVLPSFEKYIILDPDFSLLLESSSIDFYSGGVCSSHNRSKLTPGAIAGIVLGGVALIVIVIIISTSLIFKKYRFSNFTMKVRTWSSNRRSSKSFNLKNFNT